MQIVGLLSSNNCVWGVVTYIHDIHKLGEIICMLLCPIIETIIIDTFNALVSPALNLFLFLIHSCSIKMYDDMPSIAHWVHFSHKWDEGAYSPTDLQCWCYTGHLVQVILGKDYILVIYAFDITKYSWPWYNLALCFYILHLRGCIAYSMSETHTSS